MLDGPVISTSLLLPARLFLLPLGLGDLKAQMVLSLEWVALLLGDMNLRIFGNQRVCRIHAELGQVIIPKADLMSARLEFPEVNRRADLDRSFTFAHGIPGGEGHMGEFESLRMAVEVQLQVPQHALGVSPGIVTRDRFPSAEIQGAKQLIHDIDSRGQVQTELDTISVHAYPGGLEVLVEAMTFSDTANGQRHDEPNEIPHRPSNFLP